MLTLQPLHSIRSIVIPEFIVLVIACPIDISVQAFVWLVSILMMSPFVFSSLSSPLLFLVVVLVFLMRDVEAYKGALPVRLGLVKHKQCQLQRQRRVIWCSEKGGKSVRGLAKAREAARAADG